jgi:hypothetical protein
VYLVVEIAFPGYACCPPPPSAGNEEGALQRTKRENPGAAGGREGGGGGGAQGRGRRAGELDEGPLVGGGRHGAADAEDLGLDGWCLRVRRARATGASEKWGRSDAVPPRCGGGALGTEKNWCQWGVNLLS